MNYNEEDQQLKQRELEIRLRELELEIARETQETDPPCIKQEKRIGVKNP